MSDLLTIPDGETGFDQVLSFSIPDQDARGRIVRLGPLLDTVLSAHDYPPPIRHMLAEALAITALIGSLLKEDGSQLTMQAQTEDGVVSLLVCDYRQGELRGYAQFDAERLSGLGANPSLTALFGKGFLAITFDLAVTGQRYQGIVSLEGESLAQACENYFAQSEQVPTLIRLGIRSAGGSCIAGGLLIQHLPEGEEGRERLNVRMDHPQWQHVSTMAGSIRHDELVDRSLSLEQVIWRLFHEESEIRVNLGPALTRGCRCTAEYYHSVLVRFPEEERKTMRDDAGMVNVDCAFCSKVFQIAV